MIKLLDSRTKFEVLAVATLLFGICISYSVLGGLTIYNGKMSTTQGAYFLDGTFDFTNNTFFKSTTKIVNSRGHLYNVSEGNLQRATWDLNSTNGGWISLPACTIILTKSYQSISNLELRGSGANATTLLLAPASNCHMIRIDNKTNILIEKICFNLNNHSQTFFNNYSAIFLRNFSRHIKIVDCSFWHGQGSYIFDYWYSPADNVTVQDCDFHAREKRYWQGAISFAGHDCIAKNNYIEDAWAVGIRFHGSVYYTPYPHDNIADGNIITGEIGHGIHMEYATNCTIINNIIDNINSTAYMGYDGASAYSSGILVTTGCLVSNNLIIRPNYRGIASQGNSIITNNRIYDVENHLGIQCAPGDIVSNNIILTKNINPNKPTYGIWAYRNAQPSSCTITDNTLICRGSSRFDIAIYCSNGGNYTVSGNRIDKAAVGIRIDSSRDSTITGNLILNCTSVGLYLNACQMSAVSDNALKSVAQGIRLYKTQNSTCTGNIVESTSQANPSAIFEDSAPCDYNLITGNNVQGCAQKTIGRVGIHSIISGNIGFVTLQYPTTPPANPVAGNCWFNATTGQLGIYNGTTWLWK